MTAPGASLATALANLLARLNDRDLDVAVDQPQTMALLDIVEGQLAQLRQIGWLQRIDPVGICARYQGLEKRKLVCIDEGELSEERMSRWKIGKDFHHGPGYFQTHAIEPRATAPFPPEPL